MNKKMRCFNPSAEINDVECLKSISIYLSDFGTRIKSMFSTAHYLLCSIETSQDHLITNFQKYKNFRNNGFTNDNEEYFGPLSFKISTKNITEFPCLCNFH